jgi:hypothetical protein
MLASGTNLPADKNLRRYYGIGSPSPMPLFHKALLRHILLAEAVLFLCLKSGIFSFLTKQQHFAKISNINPLYNTVIT